MTNVVVINRDFGSGDVSAEDTTSIAKFGERRRDYNLAVTSDTLAQSYADHILAQGKDPQLRVDSVTISPSRDYATMLAPVLGAELGDRVEVHHNPVDDGGASADIDWFGFIEHVEMAFDLNRFDVTWRLSPQSLTTVSF